MISNHNLLYSYQCLAQSSERLLLATHGNRYRDPEIDIMWRETLNGMSQSSSSPSKLREPQRRETKSVRARVNGEHQENKLSESTKKSACELTETEAASTGPILVYTRSSANILYLLAQYFDENLDYENNWVSVLVPAFGILFLLLGCSVQFQYDSFSPFSILCFAMLVISQKPVFFVFLLLLFFIMRDRKEVNTKGREVIRNWKELRERRV